MVFVQVKVGMKFGELTVIDAREQGKKRESWLCECSCGNKKVLGRTRLLGTKNRRPDKSCGCKEHSWGGKITNKKKQRIYNTWYEMNKRCYNPNADNYERYGGSGVTVCDEWREDFSAFLKWALANGYDDGLTIDRVDNKKPYTPDNCRWTSYFTQMQNRGLLRNNTTGINGVTFSNGKYRAYITRNKIHKNLGSYDTLTEAESARKNAEEHYKKYGTIENL